MIYMNSLMKFELNKFFIDVEKQNLDDNLAELLDFIQEDECFFFKFQYLVNVSSSFSKDSIIEQFLDLSGYEISINKFHIEDYVKGDVFLQTFLFLEEFKLKWKKKYKDIRCIIFISFQRDAFLDCVSTFSFHKYREDEVTIDVNEVESIEQPIYIEYVNFKKIKIDQ